LGQIKAAYIDKGLVRLVSFDLPLPIHPDAERAAHAVRCAGDQGRFWDMHDRLFANDAQLRDEDFDIYARAFGLDADAFSLCLANPEVLSSVREDAATALGLGLTGTPSFIIGRTNGDAVSGKVMTGALPFQMFAAQIDRAIRDAEH
jgi:protein-disulfide isomerase